MTEGLAWDADGRAYAPTSTHTPCTPGCRALIQQAPDLGTDFSQALLEVAQASGYSMASQPHVTSPPTLR
jgi:hypothetical protein